MKFIVEKEIFNKLPNVCFGVVVAKNVNNSKTYPEINRLLDEYIQKTEQCFIDKKVKDDPNILPYREAFKSLGINPNKYPCSIEALFTRIAKGKGMPHINPIVDLANAMSLKYTLPMGAHDLSDNNDDICIRLAKANDIFLPFGSETLESPVDDEVIYAVGSQVRTRRWTWRQSEYGKITSISKDIFFPIDGFIDFNLEQVLKARNELKVLLECYFNCKVETYYVDINNQEIEL